MASAASLDTIREVLSGFPLTGELQECSQLKNGHINDTYRLTLADGFVQSRFILQRINEYVFKDPGKVMHNISTIAQHMQHVDAGQDCGIIQFLENRLGQNFSIVNGGYWRLCPFIENAVAYETVENSAVLDSAGYAFGRFQYLLSGLDMALLEETIPGFHDTPSRLRQLFEIVSADPVGRAATVQDEISFFDQHRDLVHTLVDRQASGELPLRVTHNDTKYNNILMDQVTGKPLCVIDLDTVMPGLAVNDFGDAIRFAANQASEDETDLEQVCLNMVHFEAFTHGFLRATRSFLKKSEIDNLALAAILITIELASRFLADHLNGDQYFRIHRPGHNLDRARNQIKLASDMMSRQVEMNAIIRKYVDGQD